MKYRNPEVKNGQEGHWGSRLMVLLRRGGITQRRLAHLVEVTPMTVSKWVNGGGISDSKLEQLCAVLVTTPTWLRWGEQFTDEDVWSESIDGHSALERRINSQDKRLMLTAAVELSLGYVTWIMDLDANVVQWSGNASRFFGLANEIERSPMKLHQMLVDYMDEEDQARTKQAVDTLTSEGGTGSLKFKLKHRPDRTFVAFMRGAKESRCVYGLTISDAGAMGDHFIGWNLPHYVHRKSLR